MKIHLISDTHIEFGKSTIPNVCADTYVLAGDIGLINEPDELIDYFNDLGEQCDNLIWVLGNHEFYHSVYEEALIGAKLIAEECGVHLLDVAIGTQDLELNGVTFWGTTFWTDLHNHDWFAHKKIQDGLNDFYVIEKMNGRKFTAHESYEINQASRNKINWDADVIITHHNPIDIEHSRFEKSEFSYAFNNTGLEDQISDSKVKYWLYGHTHDSKITDLNGTLVVSNQVGYNSDPNRYGFVEECGYDPNLILEIS